MKKILMFITTLLFIFIVSACGGSDKNITILYTNDIHGYIANTVKDSDNNEIPALRIDNISGYKKKLLNENKNVLLVDAGDEVQGSVYGAIDKGTEMIKIMNKAGYDLAVPGNHDFDFGMEGFNRFVEEASFPYISCNFKSLETNKNILDSYKIFEFGGKKIGFVGASTPETITTSTPTFFKNQNGEFIYTFDGMNNKNDLYNSIQDAVDEIRNDVDYLIVIGHLGVGYDQENAGIRSIDVINNTTGIDAFIDGHSHTTVEMEIVKTKDNKNCVLTQTGCYLKAFGEMSINENGEITTKLVEQVDDKDNDVTILEDSLITSVNNELKKKIATLEKPLYISNPNNRSQRIIRARETNLGDFVSDSVYWYLNEYKELNCDISITNGGGIRTDIDSGDVTYLDAKNVEPFGNQVCLIKTKGINIKNALEMGVTVLENWDDEDKRPAENGGFIHVAGLKYDVDCSIPSSVKTDENKMFVSVDGNYRVKNIMVYNKQTNTYEALDDNKDYTVGGINYNLKNNGNGLTMFNNSETVVDYIEEDYMVLANFMASFKSGNESIINNVNSPLKKYNNYLMDYENPSGSGRINILNLPNN